MKKVGKTTRPFRYYLNQTPYDYTVEVMNAFKELDFVARVPEELWMEVHNLIWEAVIKTIPKKKKCKKAKWWCEEALQITEERKVKSKGERFRYTQLNAEFWRIARKDKKSFLNEQCKDTEENRREKIRDILKKTGDIKGIFHSRMDTTKGRNCKDLTEAEEIKNRCQDYTEELYKKGLNDPDNHDGVVTLLKPTTWSMKSSRALGSITMNKAVGGDGTPAKLFILKDDAVKVLHLCQQIWKTKQWPHDWP